jgi:hypothetical protein
MKGSLTAQYQFVRQPKPHGFPRGYLGRLAIGAAR